MRRRIYWHSWTKHNNQNKYAKVAVIFILISVVKK